MANMKSENDSVKSHMMNLRLKMVQQKIHNEKERIVNRPASVESSNNDLENQARLQQAMLRRQQLLDQIRREQMLSDEEKRPRSYSARRRYTPSPVPAPPSRRSLPDFQRYNNFYNNQPNPDTYRSHKPDMSQVKHVIEHTIATPRQPKPYHLPPIQPQNQVAVPQAPPPVIIPAPQPKIMQAPVQYIPSPAQHIIQQVPQPVVQNLTGQPDNRSMFNKADVLDMMMYQNSQLHQLVMNQMNTEVPRVGGAVHHHHYSNPPPPSQPAIHHYSTMPAMELRGGYPRGFESAYTGPGYGMSYLDDGNNYYSYH